MAPAPQVRRRARRLGVAVARRTGARLRVPRLLSVVVTVGGSPDHLDECLTSLRRQQYDGCEILVVDVGAPTSAGGVLDRHAREDDRIRLLDASPTTAAGRNQGLAAAVGEFVTFVDADDAVTPHGHARAIAALRRSGSDLAVFAHRPMRRGHAFPIPARLQSLHAEARLGTTLEDFPDALANTLTGTRVFRRSAYDACGLEFTDLRLGDDAHSVAAYARAARFDVLSHVGLLRREDLDRGPASRRTVDLAGLRHVAHGIDAAVAGLPGRPAAVYAAEQLVGPLVPFLDRVWRCPDDYWVQLRELVTRVRETAGSEVSRRVPAYHKLLSRLVVDDERELARRLLTEVRATPRRYPTRVVTEAGRASVVVDVGEAWGAVPEQESVLADLELGVRAEITGVRPTTGGRVELRGWAFLDNVDLTGREPGTRLVLRADEGLDVVAAVTPEQSPDADVASDLWVADVTGSGFTAVVDTSELVGRPGVWRLHATVSVDGLEGVGRAVVRPWVMAGMPAWVDKSGRTFFVDHDDAGRFELHVDPPYVREVGVEIGTRGPVLVLPAGVSEVVLAPPGGPPLPLVVDGTPGRADLGVVGLRPDVTYLVRARTGSGPWRDVAFPEQLDGVDRAGPVHVRSSRRGALAVSRMARAAEVMSVEIEHEAVVARLSLPAAVTGWETALVAGATVVPGETTTTGDGVCEVTFPLTRTAWGQADLVLPSSSYSVQVRNDLLPQWALAAAAPGLAGVLPRDELQDRLRVRVEAFAPDEPGVRVVVGAPLAPDELGQRNQCLLRAEARVEVADRDSVFLRAMFSEFANGNALGVHEELRRRGSSLELLWSVLDRSVAVPDGGTGVVEGSRAWHEAVARSRYHQVDVHQLAWFERPQEQVLIQTMHGYPYKLMGHDWWEKMGNSVQEIGSLDRRTREWSVLVSPAPYATPLLRAAFLEPAGADVPVLETGYPRNDVLVRPDVVALRARTRELLGLTEDTVAVLYAPTFRDYLSPEDRTAPAVAFFSPERLLDALPDHYVLLMRGHAFNARLRTERAEERSRIIDVTEHPDVNHLILASDVGVLDYSSLRFDYGVTDKPMVFLVPDLAAYDAARGGVIAYGPTAPGPHVTDAEQIVTWLTDLPRLVDEYAEARRLFRRDYVSLEDGRSAARLVDAVFTPRGDG